MGLFKLAFASAAAYGLYRYTTQKRTISRAAYADGEATGGSVDVRNAGPLSMASDQPDWDEVDQSSDESFPASDPPAVHRIT